MTKWYAYKKQATERKPEKYEKHKRDYHHTGTKPTQSYAPYTLEENEAILKRELKDKELAIKFRRTIHAIQDQRVKLKKGTAAIPEVIS